MALVYDYGMALARRRDLLRRRRLAWRTLGLLGGLMCLWALTSAAHAQAPATVTITGNIYGAPVTVSVTPTWAFVTADGYYLAPQVYVVTASTSSGALSIPLPSNSSSTPSGSSYVATYSSPTRTWTEEWIVPSGTTATLAQVRVFQPPANTFSFGVNQLVAPTPCSSSQALTWNGSAWACAAAGGAVYPGAGVPNSTGTAWGTSFQVGTAANDLVQLNGSSQLPAVSAALLTNFPTLNQSTTGNAATATALAATPTTCGAGQAAAGVLASGNATGCFTPSGGGTNATSIQSVGVSATPPTTNQVLQYNGTQWAPAPSGASGVSSLQVDANTALTGAAQLLSGTGLSSSQAGQQVTLNVNQATPTVQGISALAGDLGGTAASPLVTAVHVSVANSTTTTLVNGLAVISATGARETATTDTTGAVGIVTAGAGTSGTATIATQGIITCQFDATTIVEGDWVQISATTAGNCHDAGATKPASGEIVGHAVTGGIAGSMQSVLLGVSW